VKDQEKNVSNVRIRNKRRGGSGFGEAVSNCEAKDEGRMEASERCAEGEERPGVDLHR
jgi:hypothetical protein